MNGNAAELDSRIEQRYDGKSMIWHHSFLHQQRACAINGRIVYRGGIPYSPLTFTKNGRMKMKSLSTIHAILALLVAFLAILITPLNGTILGVNDDGGQPFVNINMAISASADGDTILVYPGRYVENVDYMGKNITIASLELTTGDPAYRDSTIIDGNRNGSVIKSQEAVTDAGLLGFTITNGTGSIYYYSSGLPVLSGGGIWLKNAIQFRISSCIISGNVSHSGGGIGIRSSTAYIADTVVKENFASFGGGIYLAGQGQLIFDQNNRCSVYDNTAGYAQDIVAADSRLETSIYLDMGTLCPTTDYYIFYSKSVPDWPGGFPVVDIQRGYRTEVNHDLYVSPQGNDENDGLSISTPIKSIYKALQTVASDSIYPKTIHLARGVYSTDDGQFFPVHLKPNVYLIGDSLSYPVLENIEYQSTINVSFANECRVENLEIEFGDNNTFPGAVGGGKFTDVVIRNIIVNPFSLVSEYCFFFGSNGYHQTNYTLENVTINGLNTINQSGFYNNMPDAVIRNLTIEGCHNTGGELDSPWATFYFHGNKLTLENSKIVNNTMAYGGTPVVSIGAAHLNSDSRLIMNNVLIANNQSGGYTPVFIAAFTDSTSIISNCTFANNSGGSIANILNGNLRVANSIFDNDTQMEILCQGTYPNTVSHVSFENNFIRGYPNTFSSSAVNEISFNEVVLSGDPGFCSENTSDYMAYRLGNNSICRDTGLADTTGLFLPAFDLYGNPRIYGNVIDIGCNEYSGNVLVSDQLLPDTQRLSCHPNPFKAAVRISYSLSEPELIKLSVYNLRGQLVKTLCNKPMTKGEHISIWDGYDEAGRKAANGIYFIRLETHSTPAVVTKLIKVE